MTATNVDCKKAKNSIEIFASLLFTDLRAFEVEYKNHRQNTPYLPLRSARVVVHEVGEW